MCALSAASVRLATSSYGSSLPSERSTDTSYLQVKFFSYTRMEYSPVRPSRPRTTYSMSLGNTLTAPTMNISSLRPVT